MGMHTNSERNRSTASPLAQGRSLMWLVSVLIAATYASACFDVDFERFEEITKTRVVGIVVDPPELGPGDTASIHAIIASPTEAARTYHWEVCFFNQGPDAAYACALDPTSGERLGFTLSTSETASISYDELFAVAPSVDELCDALVDIELPDFIELPDCLRGIEVTLRLTVASATGEELVAFRALTLLYPDEAERADTNRNPRIFGLLVNTTFVDGVPLEVAMPSDERVRLTALVNATDAQRFAPPASRDRATRAPEERERLSVSWFSTHGSLRHASTFYDEDLASIIELQNNVLHLGKRNAATVGDIVTVWAVVRDSRGGQDGQSWRFVLVEPSP